MGEYFDWVNVDKREFICPSDFGFGNKYLETSHKDSAPLGALHVLLSGRWNGDHIVWLGDECPIPETFSNAVFKILHDQGVENGDSGNAFDMYFENYKNISCQFKEAEREARQKIEFFLEELKQDSDYEPHNEYGVNIDNPFDGLFQMNTRRFKYAINHSKKIYYSLEETGIITNDGTKAANMDPLPILMGFGETAKQGDWLGDIIGVSDQRPEEYTLLDRIIVD